MSKILVCYFSATGVTKRIARRIAGILHADTFEIEPVVKYTNKDLKWPSRSNRAYQEMKNKKFRPLVLNKLDNPNAYDTIIIGFPIWYFTAPTIVNSFIEENNMSGKKVYVFATSGATGVDKSFKDLKKMYSTISFISGKRFNGSFYNKEILEWIK
ncbi:MAG: NAD(P)H-dependent oxidoreductase [Clostridia bacterium]|nr:NAD(P)H-dependent oxidoreductase [Clostridia bacterium]